MPQDVDFSKLHDVETEIALLGTLILRNPSFDAVAGKLKPEHFFEPLHQTIFMEIERRLALGEPATPLTIKSCLPADIDIMGMSATQYLAKLAARAGGSSSVLTFADKLAHLRAIRDHIHNGFDLGAVVAAGSMPVDEALRIYHDQVETIRMGHLGPGMRDTARSVEEVMRATAERMVAALQGVTTTLGVPTGLAELDGLTGGFQRGDLVIVAGRPGMAKSSLALSMARQSAVLGHGIGFLSLEMGEPAVGVHLATDHLYERYPVAYTNIWRGEISDKIAAEIEEAGHEVGKLPIEFDFAPSITTAEISSKARRMAAKLEQSHGVKLETMYIDYSKFVKASDRYAGQNVLEIGEITAMCRTVAKQMDCAVVLLHQLNREVEKTVEKRPSLEHLRGSGEVEQDADVVILLYRPAYYLVRSGDLRSQNDEVRMAAQIAHDRDAYRLDLIVAKQRMGPADDVSVFCDVASSAIRSPAPNPMPAPPSLRMEGETPADQFR